MHVVATAGHVDHGKSTLVKALTGTDPDRFEEEQRRGLTIDLGFAAATLPSGRRCAIVDVPGHIRFIRNMLAGVGATDACIFVVAATEGWKPQSEEHLRILELLGISSGLVVLTKVDLVDEELVEIAQLDVSDHLVGTFLANAEIVATDGVSGTGMDAFTAALDRLLARTPPATDTGRPRLWVDRSFVASGAGTVVTGTLTGGQLAVGDELVVRPGRRRVRVRAIQSLYATQQSVGPGHRSALNLAGINHGDVGRGHVVVREDQWHLTRTVDASLSVLESLDHEVSRRGAYVAYLGAGEFSVRMRILGTESLRPGQQGAVRLHLPRRLPLKPGDRFVLRESGRAETVGGGEILDVDPRLPAAVARPDRSVDRVIAERGWVRPDDLWRLTGERRRPNLAGWVTDPEALRMAQDDLRARIAEAAGLGLDLAGLSEQERAVAEHLNGVVVDAGRAHPARHLDTLAEHPFLAALAQQPFSPPEPAAPGVPAVAPEELREMLRRGLVLSLDGVIFPAAAVDRATEEVTRLLGRETEGFTVAEFRDAVGTTRKYALPLLAALDAVGVTRRRGDLRIAGRRLHGRDGSAPSHDGVN
ncbi:MAG: selenocysteine-specific translation elongation factor [Acidimicrobiia bacterium]|nr:selenocysteine-specific translation elongation factor [Acidimicrobiia bacterium]MYC46228.1 selenocysteine-specific translation elongation factor [Acidimicrobiia bacterium]MYI18837.1 selenocysteine-specific translation elongation factor [Acidimicrobiia bacterium]